jgi:hypothetical protein
MWLTNFGETLASSVQCTGALEGIQNPNFVSLTLMRAIIVYLDYYLFIYL